MKRLDFREREREREKERQRETTWIDYREIGLSERHPIKTETDYRKRQRLTTDAFTQSQGRQKHTR